MLHFQDRRTNITLRYLRRVRVKYFFHSFQFLLYLIRTGKTVTSRTCLIIMEQALHGSSDYLLESFLKPRATVRNHGIDPLWFSGNYICHMS